MTTPDAAPRLNQLAQPRRRAYPLAYHALRRDVDVSGVSGTGTVAYAIEMATGVLLVWDTEWVTLDWRPNMTVLNDIHGHNGQTRIDQVDRDSPEAARAHDLLARVLPDAILTHAQAVEVMAA